MKEMNTRKVSQVAVYEIGKEARIMTQADALEYKKSRPNVFLDSSAQAIADVTNKGIQVSQKLTQA
jgi:hypothetical protein